MPKIKCTVQRYEIGPSKIVIRKDGTYKPIYSKSEKRRIEKERQQRCEKEAAEQRRMVEQRVEREQRRVLEAESSPIVH